MAGNAASGTIAELFLLGLTVAMSVGGGAILSRALGVSTWWRSTLVSSAALAIGIPLWIRALSHLISYAQPYGLFGEHPLRSNFAAVYAFVVPIVVVFSSFREDALGGLAVAIILSAATAALPVVSVLRDSEELALASGVVAWVVLPAVTVLGSVMIRPRNPPYISLGALRLGVSVARIAGDYSCVEREAHSKQRISPSALSRNVSSTLRFSVPSGKTQRSRVAICRPQEAHCSGSCLTVGMVAAAKAAGSWDFDVTEGFGNDPRRNTIPPQGPPTSPFQRYLLSGGPSFMKPRASLSGATTCGPWGWLPKWGRSGVIGHI